MKKTRTPNFSQYLFAALCLLMFNACGDDFINDKAALGLNYYPVEIGNSWTYQMDSIIYDDEGLTIIESVSYLKETIIEKSTDAAGDSVFILQISKRKDLNSNWRVTDIYPLYKDDQKLRRVEENLSFLKLVFPTSVGLEWEGNQFDENVEILVSGDVVNVYENWGDYSIHDKIDNFPSNGATHDNVLVIKQADHTNNIKQRYAMEYYKEDVGLIKRILKIKDIICTGNGDCQEDVPWDDKGDQGFSLEQTLIEFE